MRETCCVSNKSLEMMDEMLFSLAKFACYVTKQHDGAC